MEGTAIKQLQSEVTCPKCSEVRFLGLKKLPCGHVLCSKCLQGLAAEQDSTGSLSCPDCHNDAAIPSEGVSGFPLSDQVTKLLDMYQQCQLAEGADSPPATCEVHISQPLALYCETCEKLVCRDCALITCTKKNHEHGFIDDMIKKHEQDLSRELEPVRKLYQVMATSHETISAAKQELQRARETKLGAIQANFSAMLKILDQEKKYLTDCVENSYKEQCATYSNKLDELAKQLSKLDSVIKSINAASSNEPKVTFLSSVAEKKMCIAGHLRDAHFSPQPLQLPEVELNMCTIEEFHEFYQSRNFVLTKSDPLQCNIERALDLSAIRMNESSDVELQLNFKTAARSQCICRKLDLVVQLHCCQDSSFESVNVKKVSDTKFSLCVSPHQRGKYELHIKCNGSHIIESPMPFFVTVPPSQLKKLSSKELKDVGAIKFHEGKVYACQVEKAIKVLDQVTLSTELTFRVQGVNKILIDDAYIYATDTVKNRLIKMNMKGATVASTGTPLFGPKLFNHPNGIRMSKDKEIYVCDSNNHRIQIFDKDLNLLKILGRKGSANGYFNYPTDLDFDEEGNIYVVDERNCCVRVISPKGLHIRNIGKSGSSEGEFARPVSITLYKKMVYVTDAINLCVSVFKLTGEFVSSFGEGILSWPECVTIDDEGFVYVSNKRTEIVKF